MNENDESGFTLIETVVVLFITGVLIVLPILSIDKMIESIQIELFFRELSSSVTMMQNHTILTGELSIITFAPSDVDTIRFRVSDHSDHPYNRDIVLDSPYYSLMTKGVESFKFHRESGNISSFRTIKFDTTQGQYDYTYLLGSGRFDFKKVDKE